jgi:hypothetical protein
VYAQLVIHDVDLVDESRAVFTTEKALSARGLPIYVFESNDEEQLLKEEGTAVTAAFGGSTIASEAQH